MKPGQRVLIVDDVHRDGRHGEGHQPRSSGGWAARCTALAFLIELVALNGRKQLAGETVFSVLKY